MPWSEVDYAMVVDEHAMARVFGSMLNMPLSEADYAMVVV